MTKSFLERIQSGEILTADGATGTNLQQRGLPPGQPGEVFLLHNPAAIEGLARDFIAAGAQILLTCTFGASRLRLRHTGLEAHFVEINRAAVDLAREAAAGSQVLLAASIGPTGMMMQPFGELTVEAARENFREQVSLLAACGVDLIVIETMYDLDEAAAAAQGAQEAAQLPLVCSFSYDRGRKSMMGVSPARAAQGLEGSGVDLIGINCGRSLEENLANLRELRGATRLPIWFKPNAGLPVTDAAGRLIYSVTAEDMGRSAAAWIEAGAQVVGGCCGASPEHVRAIAAAARQMKG
ncbi:MAG: homocysteine S-methyltransferase family protein [Bellilinea sp.]|jgi:5-methyltetrahydrofolate--homocysteine methyltransferase